ncbi:MAG: OmpA family protein [Verrucomicrobiota bacterium]
MYSKKIAILAIAATLSVGFVGCKHKVAPVPYDTYPEGGIGSTGAAGGSVDGQDIFTDAIGPGGERPEGAGEYGVFQPIYFDFESSAIKTSERSKLMQAAEDLKRNPSYRLVLEGHCDWRGTAEYNLALGDRRASAVRSYLETLGISASSLDVTSKGDQEAIEGGSAADMSRDRRVELVLYR